MEILRPKVVSIQTAKANQNSVLSPLSPSFETNLKCKLPLTIQDRIIKNRSLQVCDLLIMRYVANARATL